MATFPFQDASLDIEARIKDLVARLSLEEKVRQLDIYGWREFENAESSFDVGKFTQVVTKTNIGCLQNRNSSAAFNNKLQKIALENSRLPVPMLFSEEALHGLIWPGCTSFPQQITLAATFNPNLAYRQGRAIATECRSLGVHETWSPVLDLARDPRWGRVEEGYGEDTFLAARLAEAMVMGLQGDNLKNQNAIVAEVKHFSGYGAPTGGLNCAPAMMGKHEHEFYALPVFEAAFKAGALNAMCSYNSIDGIPVAGDHHLLTEVLRGQFGMRGFVRADMTAIAMLHSCHFVAASAREAIKMAIEAGVDMQLYDFPHDVYQGNLITLVREGDIAEAIIDQSVSRVLRVKFLLGLFERPFVDEELTHKYVHCPEHITLAREVAEQGICLLKNKNNILPIKKSIKKIAVIGPSAAVHRLGDYSGPDYPAAVNLLEGLQQIAPAGTQFVHAQGCTILESNLMVIPNTWLRDRDGKPGLSAEYFNNYEFTGAPVLVRTDAAINFNWIYTQPGQGVNSNHFAVRWTGTLKPSENFAGFIGLSSTDSMRLYIDGQLIVDGWNGKNASQMHEFNFVKDTSYTVHIDFINDQRGVRVIFGYNKGNTDMDAAVALAKNSELAIVAVGDDESTCGENLDRADLNLPGRQLELVQKIYATGTPVILVLQNGRPLSITWEDEHLAAILEAWFGGEQAGVAIAKVLYGEINPAGRLPISFPKSVGQIPVHYNRRPFGATKYVEMDWHPLYPFGYGLSYTSFEYKNLHINNSNIKPDEKVTVSIDITNTGDCAGEEVVQVYIHDEVSSVIRPYKELAGFKRIALDAHETKTVSIEIGPESTRLLNPQFKWVVEPGEFTIMVGPNSASIAAQIKFRVVL